MKKQHKNSRILTIPDLHAPYQHQDALAFLKAVKRKFKPTRVICVGDEADKHAMSFHDSDPDLLSAGDELEATIQFMAKLSKIFPQMDLVDSNHGSMVFRKAKHHGIPVKYLKSYGEILGTPEGWKWHNTLVIDLPGDQSLFVCHGMQKNGLKLAAAMGMCTLQGHYHTEFNIQYGSSPSQLYWAMQIGCLIDDTALAFAYNKVTPSRPILGCGVIIDGHPQLVPMVLDEKGRWNGKL